MEGRIKVTERWAVLCSHEDEHEGKNGPNGVCTWKSNPIKTLLLKVHPRTSSIGHPWGIRIATLQAHPRPAEFEPAF